MPVECARVAHGEPAGLAERLDPWYRDVSYTTPSTPRALAIALRDLEDAGLAEREVLPTRPPSTLYRTTPAGDRVRAVLAR